MREATLYALLSQLAGGQVYPYVVPLTEGKPAVSPPWLVFSVVSDIASDVLDGQAESRITVQIDIWATAPDDADVNRPGFPGEYFICELRLPDHRFRWKHNKLFLLLPEEYGPAFPAIVDCYTSPPT